MTDPDERDTGYRVHTRERTEVTGRRIAAPRPLAAGTELELALALPTTHVAFGNAVVAVTWREGRVLLELPSGVVLSGTPAEAAALARALTP